MTTEDLGKCLWVATDTTELSSVCVNPEKNLGLSPSGRPTSRLSTRDLQPQLTPLFYQAALAHVSEFQSQRLNFQSQQGLATSS
jgi:hypothetical protein